MYNNIISPNSKKNININTSKGKKILNNYSEFIGGSKYNIECNFKIKNIDTSSNKKIILENEKKTLKFTLVSYFESGASGDFLILIKDNIRKYVIKIISITKKHDVEIDNLIYFNNIFSKKKFFPSTKVYYHGYISGKRIFKSKLTNKTNKYIIMEFIEPYLELHHFFLYKCNAINTISSPQPQYNFEKIHSKNLILQLFYIIYMIKLNKLYHCDLHTRNLIITKSVSKLYKF